MNCDHCNNPATLACACVRCLRELKAHNPQERFYTCDSHVSEVSKQHERIRERIAVWSEFANPESDVNRLAAEDYAKILDELKAENAALRDSLKHCELAWQVLSKQYPAASPNSPADRVHKAETELAVAFDGRDEWTSNEIRESARELEDTKTALKNREDDLRTADGEASRYAGELQKEKELNKHLKRVVVAAQQWKKERETRSHLIDTRHLIDARLIEVLHTTKIVDETVADQAGDSQQLSPEAIMPTSVIGMFATDVVASAAERAAGKVSGPAQAALLALAVELRRGT